MQMSFLRNVFGIDYPNPDKKELCNVRIDFNRNGAPWFIRTWRIRAFRVYCVDKQRKLQIIDLNMQWAAGSGCRKPERCLLASKKYRTKIKCASQHNRVGWFQCWVEERPSEIVIQIGGTRWHRRAWRDATISIDGEEIYKVSKKPSTFLVVHV